MFRIAAQLAIDPLDSSDGYSLLCKHSRVSEIRDAEHLDAGVVSAVELSVHDHSDAETCSERKAKKVVVSLPASVLIKHLVDLRKEATESLSVGIKVTVVVDVDRHAEFLLEVWSERNSLAESREVEELAADDAVRVICRSRECKTDCRWALVKLVYDSSETFYHGLETKVEVVSVSRKSERFDDEFTPLHGSEHHVCSACIKCQDDALVSAVVDH